MKLKHYATTAKCAEAFVMAPTGYIYQDDMPAGVSSNLRFEGNIGYSYATAIVKKARNFLANVDVLFIRQKYIDYSASTNQHIRLFQTAFWRLHGYNNRNARIIIVPSLDEPCRDKNIQCMLDDIEEQLTIATSPRRREHTRTNALRAADERLNEILFLTETFDPFALQSWETPNSSTFLHLQDTTRLLRDLPNDKTRYTPMICDHILRLRAIVALEGHDK